MDIVDPISGECVESDDVDGMLEMYEHLDMVARDIYAAKDSIRDAIGKMATGDTKTRRVRGKKMRAVVTMPDDKLDQPQLKSAWNAYPKFRDQCLKIGVIDLKMREWKKMKNETGPDDFNNFRKMVASAILPPTGLPKITIEADVSSSELAKQADSAAQEPVEELW